MTVELFPVERLVTAGCARSLSRMRSTRGENSFAPALSRAVKFG
jgi:hypothetical protein